MVYLWRMFMDPEHNSLNNHPPAQRFQIMVYLSLMWTTIFCAGTGAWLWYGSLLVGHIAIAFGAIITGWTFRTARKTGIYRDYPREDGTARYDDVWGG